MNFVPAFSDIDNSFAYHVVLKYRDVFYPDTAEGTHTVSLSILPNRSPKIHTATPDQEYNAGATIAVNLGSALFTEEDGEPMTFTYTATPTISGFLTFDGSTGTFSGVPHVNDDAGSYSMTLTADDNNTNSPSTTSSFTLLINPNAMPFLTSTPPTAPKGLIGDPYLYEFDKTIVEDPEGEVLTFSWSITPDHGWLALTDNGTHMIFSGDPNDNSYAANYDLAITVADPNPGVSDLVHTENFDVTINLSPTVGAMTDVTLLAPDGLTWNYTTSLVNDPENKPLTEILLINGSSTIPTWLEFFPSIYAFRIISSSNSYAGAHNVTLTVDDNVNPVVESTFILTININSAPQRNKYIGNFDIVNYNLLYIQFEPVDVLFTDPDGREMTESISQANGDPIPSFLVYNETESSLSGTPGIYNVGEYLMSYIATDEHPLSSNITFKITVKPCFFKCNNCTGEDYNQCTSCHDGYYLLFNQCNSRCQEGYIPNEATKQCESCHPHCSSCFGFDYNTWDTCNEGYFYMAEETTCYETWPDGYYGNEDSGNWELWDEACTKWFGGTKQECTECNNQLEFSLSGESEWSKVICILGFYLDITTMKWEPCPDGCNKCTYPNIDYCVQCSLVYLELTGGICTHWDLVDGFDINDFGVWSEIWGDGLLYSEHEWDDANLIDGDGWSSTWEIETGFTCEGTTWWEIVNPTGSVYTVSRENIATVKISEPVLFTSYDDFKASLSAEIIGPKRPYTFSYKIVEESSKLQPNETFTKFYVEVYDIKETIFGEGLEQVEIWFSDKSAVKDEAGNSFSEGKMVGNLRQYVYVSESEQETAESGGQSMKYTLMTMFSVNMGLKLVISSSASLMWSLIHVLQVFRYILLINITSPFMIQTLMDYLAVVVGELDEIEEAVPDVFNTYVIDQDELMQDITLYPKFEANGYDSPFLTILFGKQILIILVFTMTIGPLCYFLIKVVPKTTPFIYNKAAETWGSFFYNGPLRTFTELFIEI